MEKVEFLKIETETANRYCFVDFFVSKNAIFYLSNFTLKDKPLVCYWDESWFEIITRTSPESIFRKISDMNYNSNDLDVQVLRVCCKQFVNKLKKYVADLYSYTLTDEEKEYIRKYDPSYKTDEDLSLIEHLVQGNEMFYYKGDKTAKNQILSYKLVIELIGRNEFWSGVLRAAHHTTAVRYNRNKSISITFQKKEI